jgi:hypothetical protein
MRREIVAILPALLFIACTNASEVTQPPESQPSFSVSTSPPSSGEKLAPDLVRLPDVRLRNVAQARLRLRERGFKVRIIERYEVFTFTFKQGVVTDQRPDPGLIHEGRTVTLIVLPSCTPGYSKCLPPAIDYDCAGGTGDGPEYVSGPVYVSGFDPYELDGYDNDGIGCE